MNKKHKSVVKKLCRQLDRMRVAFALADDHVQELQTLHDEDDMAIEHPKKGKISRKQALKEIVVRSKFKLPKGIKPGRNYVRG